MTERLEDDRAHRRDLTGISVGALTGGSVGLLLGAALALPAVAIVVGLTGAAAGGYLGKAVASRVSVDDWDPSASDRPYVGAHAPDDDSSEPPADLP
jgi:uncharacterized protein YcfJ